MLSILTLINVKKDRIDILTEKAAHRMYTQPENIELTGLEKCKHTESIKMTFYFNRDYYDITFDKKNEIVTYKKRNGKGQA